MLFIYKYFFKNISEFIFNISILNEFLLKFKYLIIIQLKK